MIKLSSLEIVDTPKELVKKLGDKCIMGVQDGQAFYTELKVRILEVKK